MARLSSDNILKEKKTHDPDSISALVLSHKALSDVSCLTDFKNLEKLDLRLNNLTSLQGLKDCTNLKWLSVVENKLVSLKGVEGLSRLNVLNAGKNKLRSMDEVKSVVSLRALILNDNQITSICRLNQMTELNTLVLSRNPISELGESLVKVKSITKLSLSNCQLQAIDTSLKSCIELKELRLAHNDIKTLPIDLAHNKKLQYLDLGNNSITSQSCLEVLNSLVNLKSLNLQGNPVAEKDKLMNKIKKVLPNLQILNSRQIDWNTKSEKGDGANIVDTSPVKAANKLDILKEEKRNSVVEKKSNRSVSDKTKDGEGLKQETEKTKEKLSKKKVKFQEEIDIMEDMRPKRKSKAEQNELDIIDDGETSFLELLVLNKGENLKHTNEDMDRAVKEDSVSGLVTFPPKRKKMKKTGMNPVLNVSVAGEVGMGGPSSWDD